MFSCTTRGPYKMIPCGSCSQTRPPFFFKWRDTAARLLISHGCVHMKAEQEQVRSCWSLGNVSCVCDRCMIEDGPDITSLPIRPPFGSPKEKREKSSAFVGVPFTCARAVLQAHCLIDERNRRLLAAISRKLINLCRARQ